jgi:hypothetical protein
VKTKNFEGLKIEENFRETKTKKIGIFIGTKNVINANFYVPSKCYFIHLEQQKRKSTQR